ncbi:MAG: hypothetical protein WAX85_02710 [Minisyncoccia bacterium]
MEQDKKITTNLVTKNTDGLSLFGNNVNFVFVYKKTEKLASAVYMVTNLLSDNEPIKWGLRKKVSDLLSFTVSYKDLTESEQSSFIYNIKSRVLEIVSFLDVSSNGGLISHMNYSILKQEFLNLVDVFVSTSSSFNERSHSTLPEGFFEITPPDLQGVKSGVSHAKNMLSYIDIRDNITISHRDELRKSNRQNIIIGLLKKKKELTIKDIALVIKDCSEKTVQRELIALILSGIVKRVGERRWSKYSLNG